jgi:BirA family biotin operon repressor/biotin-[acetyl-CoA-carboxylase] ligase
MRTTIERDLAPSDIPLRLEVSERLPSTQDRAKALAEADAPEWTAVLAMEQTAGRGRRERRWRSDAGKGLYLSLILRPDWPPHDAGWVSLIGALAVAGVLDTFGIPGVRIKAPNDVMAGSRKIGGILVEPRLGAKTIEFVILGIGLNLSQQSEDWRVAGLDTVATSCAMEGAATDAAGMATAVIKALDVLYREVRGGERPAVLAEWTRRGGGPTVPGWT